MFDPVIDRLTTIVNKLSLDSEHKNFIQNNLNTSTFDTKSITQSLKDLVDYISRVLGYGNIFAEDQEELVNIYQVSEIIYNNVYDMMKQRAIDQQVYLTDEEYDQMLKENKIDIVNDIYYNESFIRRAATSYSSTLSATLLFELALGRKMPRSKLDNIIKTIKVSDYQLIIRFFTNFIIISSLFKLPSYILMSPIKLFIIVAFMYHILLSFRLTVTIAKQDKQKQQLINKP